MTLFETATTAQGHLFEPEVFREIRRRTQTAVDKGHQFEVVMRAAFEANPEYEFEHVWLWKNWPQRHEYGYGSDIGVDLVAQRPNGDRVAIQCKFYDDTTVPTKSIDAFLATAQGQAFDGSMLVNTGTVTGNAHTKLINARTKIIDLANLESWPIDWLRGLEDPKTVEWADTPKQPYPHQRNALVEIGKGFQQHDRGTVVMPCGTGKSLVAMWAAEDHAGKGGQVLYAVPSIALMGQTMREWAQNRTIPHQYLGVCSDPSTGKMPRGAATDLTQVHMPVSTDRDTIAERLGIELPHDSMRVVLTTYQSLPVIADAIERANAHIREGGHGFQPFDLFVLDEAHRTTGIEDAEHTGKQATGFRLAHNDEALPALRRLYMTATPRVFTPRLKAKAKKMSYEAGRDLDSFSMDDESVYGPRFFEMAFSDAIDRGLLTDYRVLVVGKRQNSPDLGDMYVEVLRSEDAKSKQATRGGLVAEGYATKLLGVLDALAAPKTVVGDPERVSGQIGEDTGTPLRSAILFTNTVARSQTVGQAGRFEDLLGPDRSLLGALSEDLQQKTAHDDRRILRVETDHMDGSTRADQRARQLAWLRDAANAEAATCRMLSNAQVLSEGVDVPALDAVVFMDPRRSTIDITQAVGRAIRRAEGKETGYIVIPVVVPEGSTLTSEEVLAGSDFKTVWDVVRALRSHDDRVDHWLNGVSTKRPIDVIDADGTSQTSKDKDAETDDEDVAVEQLTLELRIKQELEREVFSKMVDVCGDKQLWPTWGQNAASVCEQVRQRVDAMLAEDAARQEFDTFLAAIRETAGERTTEADAVEMVAQHVVTIPIFDALFADSGFAKENPMSKAMDQLLASLATYSGQLDPDEASGLAGYDMAQRLFEAELAPLTRAYRTMRSMLSADITPAEKVDLMRQIYDGFFQHAMADITKRLGIVYTPVEIVDFMVRATDAICRKHFGKGLTAEGVHILDPFVGTGTFIHQILTITDADGHPIIRDADLARKYRHELHATELVLLAYYVAALKIEAGMESREGFADGRFQQFENIVYGDTFLNSDALSDDRLEGTDDNTLIAQMQNQLPIRVIISNPPWSAGQKRANDDNPNVGYPEIEQRVRDTYGKRHREVTGQGSGKSGGNLYVEAIRWASDRVGDPLPTTPRRWPVTPGVIAFVHPNSLGTGTSLAGMRAALRMEFSDIYVVNLRGDAYKQGEEFEREGDKIFGSGSRNGVQITFLVSDPDASGPDGPAGLHYAEVPEYQNRIAKFEWLESLSPGTDTFLDSFDEVPVNPSHDWVNLTDNAFEELPISLCALSRDGRDDVAISHHALGLTTNCDTYAYSFNRHDLAQRMRAFIAAYERARRAIHERRIPLDAVTANDEVEDIKWHARLRQAVKANTQIEFDEDRIRPVLYRPFQQLWLYEDDRILSSVRTIAAMFPRDRIDPPPPLPAASWSAGQVNFHSEQSQGNIPPIYASPADRPTRSPDRGGPDHGHIQHDVPRAGHKPDAGPRSDKGIAADTNAAAFALTPPPPASWSRRPPTEPSSAVSSATPQATSTPSAPTSRPESSRDCQHPDEQSVDEDAFRDSRDPSPSGPQHPRRWGEDAAEALLIASTSNRTVFDVLASWPDAGSPRHRPSVSVAAPLGPLLNHPKSQRELLGADSSDRHYEPALAAGNRSARRNVTSVLTPELKRGLCEVVVRVLRAQVEDIARAVGTHDDIWDHAHLSYTRGDRWTQEGELTEFGLEVSVAVCPTGVCIQPEDGGIVPSKRLVPPENDATTGSSLRSDEDFARRVIEHCCSGARIEKLADRSERMPDFRVHLVDGSTVGTEVTMHVDGERRALSKACQTLPHANLAHEWHVQLVDTRYVRSYASGNSFSVRAVTAVIAAELARIESAGVDVQDDACLTRRLESAIEVNWADALGPVPEAAPPLTVLHVSAAPPDAGIGNVTVQVGTSVHNFRRVTETRDMISATQTCIDHKLKRGQWTTRDEARWLVVVLDTGEPATQLASAFEYPDCRPDLGSITFPGIDEVWVTANDDDRVPVLRLFGCGTPWSYCRDVLSQPRSWIYNRAT